MSSNKLISLSKVSIIDLLEVRGKYGRNQGKIDIPKEMTSSKNIVQNISETNKCFIDIVDEISRSEDRLSILEKPSLCGNDKCEYYLSTSENNYLIKEKEYLKHKENERLNTTFGLWNKIQHDIDSITSIK